MSATDLIPVLPDECAPHPEGMLGRCRSCGAQEGTLHTDGCTQSLRNPLSPPSESPSKAPVTENVPDVAEGPPDVSAGPSEAVAGPPDSLTEPEVKVLVPSLKPGVRMVLLGERIYLRDGDEFRLLGNGANVDLLRTAQLKIAEGEFLEASVTWWREVDRLVGVKLRGGPVDGRGPRELRDRVQEAWEKYRGLLDEQ